MFGYIIWIYAWEDGNMGIWEYGNMGIWEYGILVADAKSETIVEESAV